MRPPLMDCAWRWTYAAKNHTAMDSEREHATARQQGIHRRLVVSLRLCSLDLLLGPSLRLSRV